MKSSLESFKEPAVSQGIKTLPEFLRPSYPRPFSFQRGKLSPLLDKHCSEETDRELADLRERFAKEKRRPSGTDTYAVRTRVLEKYQIIKLQQGTKNEIWQCSERILNVLRTPGLTPVPDHETKMKAMTAFIDKVAPIYFPEVDPESSFYLGPRGCVEIQKPVVTGPNEYFIQSQPELVMNYGYPFYTSVCPPSRPTMVTEPIPEILHGINVNFFGALVAGDKRLGHDVVFYLPESQFYFLDPVLECYVPTTEAKLRLGLSLVIQRQANALVIDQAMIILNQYLTHFVLGRVLAVAKSLLAVEAGFFERTQAKPRFARENQVADAIAQAVRTFIESQVSVDESSILTVTECLPALNSYLQDNEAPVAAYKKIKVVVQAKMREIHGKGLRNDLILSGNRCVAGWKGLRLETDSGIRVSGESVSSASQ